MDMYFELRDDYNHLKSEKLELMAEVERLTKQNALATPRHLIASQDITSLREQVERLKAELSNITGWGRGLESDLSWARAELMQVKAEVERLTAKIHELENKEGQR
jgi:chromosome segregation ATPase